MHFYFSLSIDCPWCKVQIILLFSVLHRQFRVYGCCSVIHRLLFTVCFHNSFHRKKIHNPLCPCRCMVQERLGWGEQLCHLFQRNETSSLKHSHAYGLHIDPFFSHTHRLASHWADTAILSKSKTVYSDSGQNIAVVHELNCLLQKHCQLTGVGIRLIWNKRLNSKTFTRLPA